MCDRSDTFLDRGIDISFDGVSLCSNVRWAIRLPELGRCSPWDAQGTRETGIGVARAFKQCLDITRVDGSTWTRHEVLYWRRTRAVLVTAGKELRVEVRESVGIVVDPFDGIMREYLDLHRISARTSRTAA